jgi:hypothetical protein
MQKYFYKFHFLLFLLLAGVIFPTSASAFFSATSTAKENSWSAGTIGATLMKTPTSGKSRTEDFSGSHGTSPFVYSVSLSTTTQSALCGDLQVQVKKDGKVIYGNGPLSGFTYATTTPIDGNDSVSFQYDFSANQSKGYTKGCDVSVVYKAHQSAYPYGTAFYDTKTDVFTLLGKDFGTPAPSQGLNKLKLPQKMTLTEVMYNPGKYKGSSADTNREWVEIYNGSTSTIDLTNWKLNENNTNHGINSYKGSQFVAPGAYAIIADDAATFVAEYGSIRAPVFDSSFTLPNDADTITLKNASGTAIDSMSYPPPKGASDNGKSLQLNASGKNWCVGNPTPGAENTCGGSEQALTAVVVSKNVGILALKKEKNNKVVGENAKTLTIKDKKLASPGSSGAGEAADKNKKQKKTPPPTTEGKVDVPANANNGGNAKLKPSQKETKQEKPAPIKQEETPAEKPSKEQPSTPKEKNKTAKSDTSVTPTTDAPSAPAKSKVKTDTAPAVTSAKKQTQPETKK